MGEFVIMCLSFGKADYGREQDMRGKFIVFEGIDGSGKSTQLKLAAEKLREKGYAVYETAEPSRSDVGAFLRECLTGKKQAGEDAVAMLFAADRLEHIREMQERLEKGEVVLCDRYYYSSFAYNGGFVPLEWVISLNSYAMEKLPPDLCIYVDVTPTESMARVTRRGECERYETLSRQQMIYDKYGEIFRRFPEKVKKVKGVGEIGNISAQIMEIIEETL